VSRPLGVLLANLGTPASPAVADVQRFLDEFLSDPAVVKFPRFVWLPLLRGIILPRRAPKSAHAYASIWTEQGSPLMFHTRALAHVSVTRAGDPYETECQRTADALARELGLARETWTLAYQSRFGPEKWLGPATRDVVLALARKQVKCAIVLPGFATDCLETLEEIGKALAEEVRAAGGAEFTVVPALNTHPRWVTALAELVRRSADAPT
jgi:protoheme ferro-lyase